MVKVVIIHTGPGAIDVGWVDVHQVKFALDVDGVAACCVAGSMSVDDGRIGFAGELREMVCEGAIPGGFVAEASLDARGAHVEILPMKEIVGAFDHGGLKKGVVKQRPLESASDLANVLRGDIQPCVFPAREVNVFKRSLNEVVVADSFLKGHCILDVAFAERRRVVFNQGDPDLVVKRECVVVGDALPFFFERMCDDPGSPEGVEYGCKVEVGQLIENGAG